MTTLADTLRNLSALRDKAASHALHIQKRDETHDVHAYALQTDGGTQHVIEARAHGQTTRILLTETGQGWIFAKYDKRKHQWQSHDVKTRAPGFLYGVARQADKIPGVRTYTDARMESEVKRRVMHHVSAMRTEAAIQASR